MRPVPAGLAMLLLASCYDAPRDNPFDPALTPPVGLQVALDDTAGTAVLTWSSYQGQQPFAGYWVLRNIVDRRSVDTLAHIAEVEQTAYVDTTLAPNTAYVYRVSVVNAGGFEMPSEERNIPGFGVGAVQLLAVEGDPQEGVMKLRWNRFVGPDFRFYQVRRRVVGTDREEVLGEVLNARDTTFADRSARAEVEYGYQVSVQAAGQELVSNSLERRLHLPPVVLSAPEFDSRTASASLRWTQYAGPRFRSYRVERWTAELSGQTLKETPDIADTSLVDSLLLGNTEYFYQVMVLTEREEEVAGEEKSGAFHPLLAAWPLGEEESAVRLYAEPGDRIAALVVSPRGARMLFFDPEGRLLEEEVLIVAIGFPFSPRSMATALGPEGQRFFSLVRSGTGAALGILSFEPDRPESLLFTDAFPQPLRGAEGKVLGEIALLSGNFDKVTVSTGGRLLFAEDFAGFPEGRVEGSLQGWDFGQCCSAIFTGWLGTGGSIVRRADEAWQNFRLEVDAVNTVPWDKLAIQIGGDTFSHFVFRLDPSAQQVTLDWVFSPGELDLASQEKRFAAPFPLMRWVPYHLSLEVVDGQVRAAVQSPFRIVWRSEPEPGDLWTSLVALGNLLAFVVDDRPYTVTQAGEATPQSLFEARASELRAWEDPRVSGQQVGVCFPELNQLRLGRFPKVLSSTWSSFLSDKLGPVLEPPGGHLFYPVSFDVGPDGRIYVLDAGNARIAVFDAQRRFLTQWGRQGRGEGEFDFGTGTGQEGGELDFAGSVCVDRQGNIYVADGFNRRIQKFAP